MKNQQIKNHLMALGLSQALPQSPSFGVCMELTTMFGDEANRKLLAMSKDWPGYSGNSGFPIPYPGNEITAMDAYAFTKANEMWNPNFPYGNSRLEYCIWHSENWDKYDDEGVKIV